MDSPQQPASSQGKKFLPGIIAVVVLIVGGAIAYAAGLFNGNPSTNPTQNPPVQNPPVQNPPVQNPPSTTPVTTGQTYKDGTYTVNQDYQSPGGDEKFTLAVTLQNGTITAATFTPNPVSPTGKMKQNGFNQAYQPYVVGKNIDDVSVGILAGASLTSAAFMQALAKVKAQAAVS